MWAGLRAVRKGLGEARAHGALGGTLAQFLK